MDMLYHMGLCYVFVIAPLGLGEVGLGGPYQDEHTCVETGSTNWGSTLAQQIALQHDDFRSPLVPTLPHRLAVRQVAVIHFPSKVATWTWRLMRGPMTGPKVT